MKTTGINALDVYVGEVAESVRFYVETLGFEDGGESGPGHMLKVDDLHVYVEGGYSGVARDDNECGVTPVLDCESVKRMYQHLKDSGVEVGVFHQYGPTFAMFRFADPSGNRWSFAGRP